MSRSLAKKHITHSINPSFYSVIVQIFMNIWFEVGGGKYVISARIGLQISIQSADSVIQLLEKAAS